MVILRSLEISVSREAITFKGEGLWNVFIFLVTYMWKESNMLLSEYFIYHVLRQSLN